MKKDAQFLFPTTELKLLIIVQTDQCGKETELQICQAVVYTYLFDDYVNADCFVVAPLCLNELQCSGYKYKPEHSAAATAEVAFNASECVIICLEFINDFVAV